MLDDVGCVVRSQMLEESVDEIRYQTLSINYLHRTIQENFKCTSKQTEKMQRMKIIIIKKCEQQ